MTQQQQPTPPHSDKQEFIREARQCMNMMSPHIREGFVGLAGLISTAGSWFNLCMTPKEWSREKGEQPDTLDFKGHPICTLGPRDVVIVFRDVPDSWAWW